jgi:hypothetical protein
MYSVKSNAICLRLVVEGSKVGILVDEQDVLYNCYYKGSTDYASGATNYDKTVSSSGGDFVMGVMNDTTTDKANTIIKRFAFYNGATAQENVTHNCGSSAPADALAKAQAKMTFLGGCYVPYAIKLVATQQYVGKKEFVVGETIVINLADYFRADIDSKYTSGTVDIRECTARDLTFKGTFTGMVWQYTFTEEDATKSKAFAIQVNHSKADGPMVLAFRVNVLDESQVGEVCPLCGHHKVDGVNCLNQDCLANANPDNGNGSAQNSGENTEKTTGCNASVSGLAVMGMLLTAGAVIKYRRKGEEQ